MDKIGTKGDDTQLVPSPAIIIMLISESDLKQKGNEPSTAICTVYTSIHMYVLYSKI